MKISFLSILSLSYVVGTSQAQRNPAYYNHPYLCCPDGSCGKSQYIDKSCSPDFFNPDGSCNQDGWRKGYVKCPTVKCCPVDKCIANDFADCTEGFYASGECLTQRHFPTHQFHVCSNPNPPKKGSGSGDPHFLTWSGLHYDFHGGCDLVFMKNPGFANNLGMDIHIRTQIKTWWSYISAAVVRVGNDTIEVMGGPKSGESPRYWINGKPGAPLGNGLLTESLSGSKITYKKVTAEKGRFRIDLGHGDIVSLTIFHDFVRVDVKAKDPTNFETAVGLMGSYPSGTLLGRDNSTVIDDINTFGKEWQVLDSESQLFHTNEGTIQHPKQCAMPEHNAKESRNLRRRLGESMITEERAAWVCASVGPEDLDACIADVLATNNLEMAGAY